MPVSKESSHGRLAGLRRSWRAWTRLARFFERSRLKLVVLAPIAAVAGLAEAGLLAIVAAAALALSQGDDRVRVDVGPLALDAELSVVLGAGIGLTVLRGVLHVALAYLPANVSANAMASLRRRLFDSFVEATWAKKSTERDGQFQSLMIAQIQATAEAIIAVGAVISAGFVFVTLLVSALALSLVAAAALTLSSVVLLGALRPLSRRLRRSAELLSAEYMDYSTGVQEVALMAEESQVFGASPAYRSAFYERVDAVRQPLLRTRFLTGVAPSLYQSAAQLLLVLALMAVSFIETSQLATLGAVVLLLVRAQSYGQRVQQALTSVDEKVPFMNHLADALDSYASNGQTDGDEPLPAISAVGMSDVRFAYPSGPEVLHGISFEARSGEAIGIVGPSGAGKSSLVQLLLRLREPTSGVVTVNGQDVARFRRADWQQRVSYVPQTPQLIYGTVTENIRFFRPQFSDTDVREAAMRAHIHDEIMSWPHGYDTVIGQRVSAVSGGQRQRLCIARALVSRPDVLILDEPTSALDVRSEELVQESLEALKADMVLFLVAHRMSTLAICSRVMVVVDGRVQAIEDHDRLLEVNDFYREVAEITRRRGHM